MSSNIRQGKNLVKDAPLSTREPKTVGLLRSWDYCLYNCKLPDEHNSETIWKVLYKLKL